MHDKPSTAGAEAVSAEELNRRLRRLFDSIDEGVAISEMIYGDDGEIVDMVYRDVNRAYEREGGVRDVIGRSKFDVLPGIEDYWLECFKKVARSGEPVRIENYQQDVDRWFDVYFTRVDDDGRFVAIVFKDITERKRAETQLREGEELQAFELRLSDVLALLTDPAAIQTEAMRLIGEKLDVGWCYFNEFDERGTHATVLSDFHRRDLPSMTGVHDLSGERDFLDLMNSGAVLDVADLQGSEHVSAKAKAIYGGLGLRSALAVPLLRNGRLVAVLLAADSDARAWTFGQVDLLKGAAERTWAALQRARAEATLRDSEDRQGFFLSLGDSIRSEVAADAKIRIAARLLGERLRASRVLFTEYDWTRNIANTFSGWIADGAEPFDAVQQLEEYEGEVLNDLKTGRLVRVDNVGARSEEPAFGAIAALGVQALLSPPLLVDGKLKMNLSIHQHEPRHWTDDEVALVQEVAERLWAEVVRARAEKALRESERHAQTLLAELQHRVRNTLAVVRSIARRTAENSSSAEDMLAHFQGRLDAFSRVQAAVTRSADGKVDLESLIEDELVAHAARGDGQVRIRGPAVALDPKAAERLSLAVHELTTNAVKHGALINDNGQISVSWTTTAASDGGELVFNWIEKGVEVDMEQVREDGFGMELLRGSLPYDLQAETTVDLQPTGLRFELTMPLPPAT